MEKQVLFTLGKHAYEVCEAPSTDRQCRDCAAFENMALCKKFPHCTGLYFKKLNNYEIRQLKRQGLI